MKRTSVSKSNSPPVGVGHRGGGGVKEWYHHNDYTNYTILISVNTSNNKYLKTYV